VILLTTTSDLLELVTGSTQTIHVHCSYVDMATSANTFTPGRLNNIISTATTTNIVASPAANTYRTVKTVSIVNTGTSAETVTVQHTDGTHVVQLASLSLNPSNALVYSEDGGWHVLDTGGNDLVSIQHGRFQKIAVLPGSTNFTLTYNVGPYTNTLKIRAVAAGGGGGGCTSVASAAGAGGGGGAGAYGEWVVAVTPGQNISYIIPFPTTPTSGAAGGAPAPTTVTVGSTTFSVPGGRGGAVGTASTAVTTAAGGTVSPTATNGTLNGAGAPGRPGLVLSVGSGTSEILISGTGGSSPWGEGGVGLTAAGTGNNGTGYGAGGGGSAAGSSAAQNSTQGAPGLIIIEEWS
jgi:hypothetical protein